MTAGFPHLYTAPAESLKASAAESVDIQCSSVACLAEDSLDEYSAIWFVAFAVAVR